MYLGCVACPIRVDRSCRLCGNRLVGVVGLTVGEEVVDDHADDGEEEDDECPKHLVGDGAVGLEDLDPGNDVENKDDEANDATAGTSLPRLS